MKNQKRFIGLSILVIGIFIFSSSTFARPIELSFNHLISAQHNRYVLCFKPWMDMIEKRTGGKVKFTSYFSNSLTPITEKFNSTVSGMADMSEMVPFVTPGRFPLSEIIALPESGLETAENASKALWHLYKTIPEMKKEYKGVKLLFLYSCPKMMLATTKKPIRRVEDLKGLKIWSPGSIPVMTGKALGYSPVFLPPGEVYLALEKGVLDGMVADFEITIGRRFIEVTRYMTTNIYIQNVPFAVIMNQGVWDGLPKDVQKVFEKLSGEWAGEFFSKTRDKEELEWKKVAIAKGMELIELPPEDLAKVRSLVKNVKDKYAADLEAKGLPGKKALAEIEKFAIK